MQFPPATASLMPFAGNYATTASPGLLKLACTLWLAGVAMRMTLLVMPPVIPLVHEDLHMSETQIGLLIGLPLAVFAVTSVPASLLIARIGASLALILGMVVTAVTGGARAASSDVWTLYLTSIATGVGISIMQPAMPTVVREWLPNRIAFGTIAYSAGMVIGATLPPVLTIPLVLPWLGGSWRLDLAFWAVPAILIVPIFLALRPQVRDRDQDRRAIQAGIGGRWWPEWRNPLVWLLGLTFGSNNSPYYVTNAFLGDYLASFGRSDLLAPALGWLNGSQVLALVFLVAVGGRIQRRAWPFLVFGPLLLLAFLGVILVPTGPVIIVAAAIVGFTCAVTMTAALALPALLVAPGDVSRTAAGMFTISYTSAIIVPTICGAFWDATGKPWTAFAPLCISALGLTVLGAFAARYRSHTEKARG